MKASCLFIAALEQGHRAAAGGRLQALCAVQSAEILP